MLRLNRAADAEQTLRDALAGLEARAGETGETRLADVRVWLGRTLVERGQGSAAEAFLRPAVAYRDKTLATSHPRVAEARCELARALAVQQRMDEARGLLDSCWPIYQKWGLADPIVAASLGNTVASLGPR